VVDASGVPETFPACLKLARTGGVVVEAGAFVDLGPVGVNPAADVCTRNVTVIGIGGELLSDYAPALELLAANLDRLPLERIITHRLPLSDAQAAVELAQRDGAMKVVLGGR
jgi:threonine dehydrogenase-like Zn-dependent dehydrogenase